MSRMRVRSDDGEKAFIRETNAVRNTRKGIDSSVVSSTIYFIDFEHFVKKRNFGDPIVNDGILEFLADRCSVFCFDFHQICEKGGRFLNETLCS